MSDNQYVEFVSKFGSDYPEDRTATLAAARKYQPDMETLTLAVDVAVEWLCSFRGQEPVGVGPEMIDAAVKAGVATKDAGGYNSNIEDEVGAACIEVFGRLNREVDAGTRALAPERE